MIDNSELFHYTSEAGLKGIISSRTLWATRYDCLNDSSEMSYLKSLLIPPLAARIRKYLAKQRINSPKLKNSIERDGGIVASATYASSTIIELMHKAVFGAVSPTYISSFCTHDDAYEINNGLLSQWRGYGGAGYSIVFDRESIFVATKIEESSYAYQTIFIKQAIYDAELKINDGEFNEVVDSLFGAFLDTIKSKKDGLTKAFEEFAIASSYTKHPGFREEKEIRIVSAPLTSNILSSFKDEVPDFDPGRPLKPILERSHPRTRSSIPYIELFSSGLGDVKINRIIVGPGPKIDERYDFAKSLVSPQVPIVKSQTPFIG